MEIDVVETPAGQVDADVLVFPVSEPLSLPPSAQELDRLVEGRLSRLAEEGELRADKARVTLLRAEERVAARRVGAAGLGDAPGDPDRLRTAAAAVARQAKDLRAATVAWLVEEDGDLEPAAAGRAIVEGTALGAYEVGRWKTEKKDGNGRVERLILCGPGAPAAAEAARRAGVVARWTNRCRDLVNAPANELTPDRLAAWAEGMAGQTDALRFEALGPKEIEAAGMGALEAVSRGSHNPARLITLSYEPPEPTHADLRLGLVGKAITFDAGGLSLKPPLHMDEMKSDMGGGGAVVAAMGAIAELGLPVRVLAVVAACENLPSGHAYRPGDIVTALNGKTIEITNTDAEGRLVLADALWHARQSGATHVLDLATLTGAVVIALGDFYAGLMGNDDAWVAEVEQAADASGDYAWRLPLHETYDRYLESRFADLKNSSDLKQASPIYAARFLEQFAGEGPWAHLDIAGTAYLERGRGDYYGELGATGYGVRLLAELATRLSAAA
ncbi:MAG TPA: leucyl aminopeptidase [Gaiellaceae bacterium]|nr:leucyl aminopeptidase [Gaiellaceae bacterium]